jgi:hypothetical protein
VKTVVFSAILLALPCCGSATAGDETPLPGGWKMQTFSILQYRIGLDYQTRHTGKSAGFIQGEGDNLDSYISCSLVQSINGKKYRGKRLRMAAFVKSQKLAGLADFHIRAICPGPEESYDTRLTPHIKINGDTDWNRHEVVFTVPDNALEIELGVRQTGTGRTWIDDVTLEVAAAQGATDNEQANEQPSRLEVAGPALPDNIENSDFEQTKSAYDLGLMQGRWEFKGPAGAMISRKTKQFQGNSVTTTDYTENGAIWQQNRQDISLEQKGPVSLCTFRNFEVTAGPAKGQKTPPGWSHAYMYFVNRNQFIEMIDALDGLPGPPQLI